MILNIAGVPKVVQQKLTELLETKDRQVREEIRQKADELRDQYLTKMFGADFKDKAKAASLHWYWDKEVPELRKLYQEAEKQRQKVWAKARESLFREALDKEAGKNPRWAAVIAEITKLNS